MSERFFHDGPLDLGPVELTGPEAHHLAAVCRLHPGDQVCLFNGAGLEYPARILTVGRKSATLEVLAAQAPPRELDFFLEVAAALPKGDRGQFLVEKLTELGVTSFVPLECQRSVVHAGAGKLEKLHRHVIEASKQCGRNTLMQVAVPTPSGGYWSRGKSEEELLLAADPSGDPLATSPPAKPATDPAKTVANPVGWVKRSATHPSAGQTCRLAIGPEGGFTPEELAAARDAGWRIVSLGPRILRVETAALALASALILG